jgi:hypothetical protein
VVRQWVVMDRWLTTGSSLYGPVTDALFEFPVVQSAGEPTAEFPPEGRLRLPSPRLRSANAVQICNRVR